MNNDDNHVTSEAIARVRSAPVQHPQLIESPQPLEVHPSVSPVAAELLMGAAERIARHPDQYAQRHLAKHFHKCGTACCILGHMGEIRGVAACAYVAQEKMGLTPRQFDAICYTENWPKYFKNRYPGVDYKNMEIPAEVGVARIEHFLRTGE